MKLQEIFLRLVFLFCGLTIAHLGVTLFLLANLGADPFNVFVQGLNHLMRGFNLTHGIIHMCISFMIILVLLVVDRSYIKAGTGPNDLVAVVISEKGHFNFGLTRVITDSIFVLAGFMMGGKLGIGTIICAFLVGFVADFFMPYSQKFINSALN